MQFNCSSLSGLAACAEPQCADIFSLQRNASGAIVCRATGKRAAATTRATIVIPYTYDQIFQFGSNVVLGGYSIGGQVGPPGSPSARAHVRVCVHTCMHASHMHALPMRVYCSTLQYTVGRLAGSGRCGVV